MKEGNLDKFDAKWNYKFALQEKHYIYKKILCGDQQKDLKAGTKRT